MHDQCGSSWLERLFSTLFSIAAVAVVVLSLGVAMVMMPVYWKGFVNAATTRERLYFAMRFTAMWCFLYFFALTGLFMIDGAFFDAKIMSYWPTLSWLLFDWDMSHLRSVRLDAMLSLFMVFVAGGAAYFIGSENDQAEFVPPAVPDRILAQDHCTDIMARYNAVVRTDPKLDPNFKNLKWAEQHKLKLAYDARLLDISTRVREVYRTWKKPNPID